LAKIQHPESGKTEVINSDESAPIFDYSHIGVVGDHRGVLEAFNDEIRKIVNALPPAGEKKRNQ
jgi:hypothetical protein